MTQEQKNENLLRMLQATPDSLLREDNTDDIFNALNASAKAGTGADVNPGGNVPPVDNTIPVTGTAGAIPVPPIPGANTATQYTAAVQPIPDNRITFKLKELFDPELVIMILDMLLSWGGSLLLQSNGIECTAEDLRADELQREILIKGFRPAFESYEVGTKNPMAAMGLAMVGVYGKNIMEVIRINNRIKEAQKKGDKEIEVTKRKLPKYVKPERKQRVKKVPTINTNTSQGNTTKRFI